MYSTCNGHLDREIEIGMIVMDKKLINKIRDKIYLKFLDLIAQLLN